MRNKSEAIVLTFTDQAAYNAATLGYSFQTENFSSYSPTLLADNIAHAFNGFTATSTEINATSTSAFYVAPSGFTGALHSPFTISQHLGWSEDVTTSAFAFNGTTTFGPSINLVFQSPVSAVSFRFLDSDVTDEYRLLIDGVLTAFPATATTFSNQFFFGIFNTSGTFQTLTFDTLTTSPGGFVEEFGVDDISFSSSNAVPEPTSICVWLSMLCLASRVRRRKHLTK